MVDDIYNGHQLASMGSKGDVGNATDLDEAFEHLKKKMFFITCMYNGVETNTSGANSATSQDSNYHKNASGTAKKRFLQVPDS